MNIKIICVGKLKEKYFKQGIAEYAKRLSKFCKFQIVEVPDEKAPEKLSDAEMEKVKEIEAKFEKATKEFGNEPSKRIAKEKELFMGAINKIKTTKPELHI